MQQHQSPDAEEQDGIWAELRDLHADERVRVICKVCFDTVDLQLNRAVYICDGVSSYAAGIRSQSSGCQQCQQLLSAARQSPVQVRLLLRLSTVSQLKMC